MKGIWSRTALFLAAVLCALHCRLGEGGDCVIICINFRRSIDGLGFLYRQDPTLHRLMMQDTIINFQLNQKSMCVLSWREELDPADLSLHR